MRFSGPQYDRENAAAAPRATWPGFEQLPLPGMGSGQNEQMRLFDTHRAGPSSVYALNPSMDAAHWLDRDKEVELDEDERELLETDGSLGPGGVFYDWESPGFSSERDFLAHRDAFGRARKETEQQGTYLGHDAYPERVNPDLTFDELQVDEDEDWSGGGTRTYMTPEGTDVGKVTYEEDEWGPYVATAEINPLYKGRKFSRDAIAHFAGTSPIEGVLHAGSYSFEGSQAFHAKGIPTTDDIEDAFENYVEGFDPDEEQVRDLTISRLEGVQGLRSFYDPSEDEPDWWDEDTWTPDMQQAYDEERGDTVSNLRYDMKHNDPYVREDFKGNLIEMQSQMLEQLEASKPGSFIPGFKPKGKTWGTQESLKF